MDLKSYISNSDSETSKLLRERLNVSSSYLSQMVNGFTSISPQRATEIEQATGRAVMRWDLRPNDWWKIWPELIDRKGSPSIPSEVGHE